MSRMFYEIQVRYDDDPAMHPITVVVRGTRSLQKQEFSGKSIRALLAKAAKWIEEVEA